MSPTMASAREKRPPAPRPWTARKDASWPIVMAKVHSTEPMMKMVMAVMKSFLRP